MTMAMSDCCAGRSPRPSSRRGLPRVAAGIDVLAGQHFAPLIGRHIGLLTNQTGRDSHGRRAIDLLATAPGVRLIAIFTPEHGLNGDREGVVDSTRDSATGLPVYSLYSATRRPTGTMLAGIDTVVIDLQDAGVRFYTYPTTVGYVLEEAAKHNLAVYVLDRPNPINASCRPRPGHGHRVAVVHRLLPSTGAPRHDCGGTCTAVQMPKSVLVPS